MVVKKQRLFDVIYNIATAAMVAGEEPYDYINYSTDERDFIHADSPEQAIEWAIDGMVECELEDIRLACKDNTIVGYTKDYENGEIRYYDAMHNERYRMYNFRVYKEVVEKKCWNNVSVRYVCEQKGLYTETDKGEAYKRMLDRVDTLPPTTKNVYRIAKDINKHSKNQTISSIMTILMNNAVKTDFTQNFTRYQMMSHLRGLRCPLSHLWIESLMLGRLCRRL